MEASRPILPPHIEQTVGSIARLHADHLEASTRHQRLVIRIVSWLGRPRSIALLTILVLCWTAGNLLLAIRHLAADPPPFAWLEEMFTLTSLCVVALVLTAQQHDERIGRDREQLALELFILREQKAAKIIGLLQEMRGHHSQLVDREDEAARAMSAATDSKAVIGVMKQRSQARPATAARRRTGEA